MEKPSGSTRNPRISLPENAITRSLHRVRHKYPNLRPSNLGKKVDHAAIPLRSARNPRSPGNDSRQRKGNLVRDPRPTRVGGIRAKAREPEACPGPPRQEQRAKLRAIHLPDGSSERSSALQTARSFDPVGVARVRPPAQIARPPPPRSGRLS